jgi:hypothetical protein
LLGRKGGERYFVVVFGMGWTEVERLELNTVPKEQSETYFGFGSDQNLWELVQLEQQERS